MHYIENILYCMVTNLEINFEIVILSYQLVQFTYRKRFHVKLRILVNYSSHWSDDFLFMVPRYCSFICIKVVSVKK